MVLVEKPFPRGGIANNETKSSDTVEKINFGASLQRIKKAKTKPKIDDSLGNDEQEQLIETRSAELLSYDTIQEGMNIMGMVKVVGQLYLTISLPGRITARVSALEISDAYTKITKQYLANTNTEQYKPLNELYQQSQLVYGRVLEVKRSEHGVGKTEIVMSLKPSEVHAELQHNNIKKGFIFNGAVAEVQEHGYIIETGIKGMRTFVSLDNSEAGHVVGELIRLKVEKITVDKATSTCTCKEIKTESMTVKNQIDPNIDYILPASIVKFTVRKTLKDGLQGSIMNEAFTAYINEHQLQESLAVPTDYELNSTLQARVLYVMPLTKFVYLTLNLRNKSTKPQYKRGDVIENAKVHHLGTGGVVLILENKHKGLISYKTIKSKYKGNYDQDELLSKYAIRSQHKVRVLDCDLMDSMYICTDHENVVNEKYFTLEDLQAGDFVTAIVKQRNEKFGGYQLQLGQLKAIIEQHFLAANTKHLEINAKLRCRILAINTERKVVYLTNRTEYMSKSCAVLLDLKAANANLIYTGTVVKCEPTFILVKFFNNLKGILHKQRLQDFMTNEVQNFYEGQTMPFRIASCKNEQIVLTVVDDTFSLGTICTAVVTHKLDSGLEIQINYDVPSKEDINETDQHMKAFIPLRLLSDFEDLCLAKMRQLELEDKLQAACIHRNIFSLRDVAYFTANGNKDLRAIKTGDILKAYVMNVLGDVIELVVPIVNYGKLVKLHTKMLVVSAFHATNIVLKPEQVVFVKILGKELTTRTVTVSALLTQVWDRQLSSTAQFVDDYLKEVHAIKKALKKKSDDIATYNIGDKVKANFLGIDAGNGDWQYSVAKSNVLAVVKASGISDEATVPAVKSAAECIVLWIDYANNMLLVSNKPSDLKYITKGSKLPENLVGKTGINAKVLLKLENVFICSLKKGPNPLVYCPNRLHFNDFEMSCSVGVKEGEFCKLTFIHDTKSIAVLESTWKLWQNIERKRKTDEKINESVKRKKTQQAKEPETVEIAKKATAKINKQIAKTIAIEQTKELPEIATPTNKVVESGLFYEDKTADLKLKKLIQPPPKAVEVKPKCMPGIGDFWNTDLNALNEINKPAESSDDDDDANADAQTDKSKKRKLTAVQKYKLEAEEEKRLRIIEDQYADAKHTPETVDQFDRLVISQPNNSSNWIKYMVFHLQSTEFDKARAVARRALKTISFRNTAELLNIWMAMLNLELNYGNKETFDETLKEALSLNDPLSVYLRTIEVLTEAKKTTELLEIIGIMQRKFKSEQSVWRSVANAYFAIGQTERAQQMLQKSLQCLPEREHVQTIIMFAHLNHKHGQHDMAQTLLDQVVTSYPKRVDVWTQYVDMLIKENLIDSARTVLERAIVQQIPLKKMKTIFKKYLEFEERFGTAESVQKVKVLAQEYVDRTRQI